MTKLAAVNKMIRGLQSYPFAALDTGGTSPASQAEIILDEHDKTVQSKGWHANKEVNVTIETADTTKVATAIASGTWTAATKTLTKTGAFSSYTWASGDQISVTGGTDVTVAWYEIGSKTDSDSIILKTSIADADNADTTTDIIGWHDALVAGSDVLVLDSWNSTLDVVLRNGMLYNRGGNTFTFGDSLSVALTRQLDFTDLSEALQNLIVAKAAIENAAFFDNGKDMGAVLRDNAIKALRHARHEDQDGEDINIVETPHALRGQGQSYIGYAVRQ